MIASDKEFPKRADVVGNSGDIGRDIGFRRRAASSGDQGMAGVKVLTEDRGMGCGMFSFTH